MLTNTTLKLMEKLEQKQKTIITIMCQYKNFNSKF